MTTPTRLPGCTPPPSWPTPRHVPPSTIPPPLTLTAQVVDTPAAHREAARLAGQLALTEGDDDR